MSGLDRWPFGCAWQAPTNEPRPRAELAHGPEAMAAASGFLLSLRKRYVPIFETPFRADHTPTSATATHPQTQQVAARSAPVGDAALKPSALPTRLAPQRPQRVLTRAPRSLGSG